MLEIGGRKDPILKVEDSQEFKGVGFGCLAPEKAPIPFGIRELQGEIPEMSLDHPNRPVFKISHSLGVKRQNDEKKKSPLDPIDQKGRRKLETNSKIYFKSSRSLEST